MRNLSTNMTQLYVIYGIYGTFTCIQLDNFYLCSFLNYLGIHMVHLRGIFVDILINIHAWDVEIDLVMRMINDCYICLRLSLDQTRNQHYYIFDL
jgi:hypothetical protein